MQVGDLVKYVGYARFYKGRVGVAAKIFAAHGDMTIQVHYPGIEGEGRDAPGLGQVHDGSPDQPQPGCPQQRSDAHPARP